jgi:probable F420-dependent oxidoreductase
MQFVFPLPNLWRGKAVAQPWEEAVTGADQIRIARHAEALGYEHLRVPEHLIVPRVHVELSGSHYFHSTAAQGCLLAATERIRVGTAVTILPLQHPIALAKALSTVDWFGGGRAWVTFAVGWMEGEFEALGVPFNKRGRIMDEYLAAIIELWTKDSPTFEGEFVSFRDVAFEPKPIQKPYIPIVIGGDNDAVLRRIARFGTGWTPFLTKPQDFPARIDFIKSQPTYVGAPFDVMYTLASGMVGEGHVARGDAMGAGRLGVDEMVDLFGTLRELGVTTSAFAMPHVDALEAYLDYAQWFAEEVKPRVNA